MWAWLAVLVWTLQCWGADSLSLKARWEIESEYPMSGVRMQSLRILSDRHVLFIPGILNEVAYLPPLSNYYGAAIQAVRKDMKVGSSYFAPHSWVPISENAQKIHEEIERVHSKVKKPLILIAHSKGGVETFLAVLRDSRLMLELDPTTNLPKVDRVVLIQASMGGSELSVDVGNNHVFSFFSWLLGDGLASLDEERAQDTVKQAYLQFMRDLSNLDTDLGEENVRKRREFVSNRIYFVRSEKNQNELSFGLQIVHWVCGRDLSQCGANDGLLKTEAQKLDLKAEEPFGIDLGSLPLDHLEATISGWVSKSTEASRRALMRAILAQIYD